MSHQVEKVDQAGGLRHDNPAPAGCGAAATSTGHGVRVARKVRSAPRQVLQKRRARRARPPQRLRADRRPGIYRAELNQVHLQAGLGTQQGQQSACRSRRLPSSRLKRPRRRRQAGHGLGELVKGPADADERLARPQHLDRDRDVPRGLDATRAGAPLATTPSSAPTTEAVA